MQAPVNTIIIKLEKKFYDSVTFQSGQTIHFDPSWNPEEYTMLKATVVSIPKSVTQRQDYEGFEIVVKPGDEILIRYDVVFSYKDQPDRDTPIYKNLVFKFNELTGRHEELWLCDIQKIFGIIKGNQIEMINGYVMLKPITERSEGYTSLIIKPESYKSNILKYKAIIKHINSKTLNVYVGDTVYINPNTVMCYEINLQKFYIIKESYILAKGA